VKVIVLAPFPPRSDGRHGGARALSSLHRRLAARHRLVLLALRRDDESTVDPELAALCEEVVEVPRPLARASLSALWSERRRGLDVLRRRPGWVVGTDVAGLHAALRAAEARHHPDLVHAEFAVSAQYARDVSAPVLVTDHSVAADGLDDAAMRRFRRAAYRDVRSVVCFTEREVTELRSVIDDGPSLHVIPLGVEVPPQALDASGTEASLLFTGSFEHPPNVDALRRIVDRVLPALRARVPDARLTVVGAAPPRHLVERPGVTATGDVASVEPYLREAAVVLGPVWTGGGMRVKVLEALAAGKAVATTRLGADGLDLTPGEHAAVADDEKALVHEVVALLEDPEQRRRLGSAGRAHVAERFAWDRIAPRYDALYEEVAAG
jgi:glycosyltransferase involved in cell wall biosynthesis